MSDIENNNKIREQVKRGLNPALYKLIKPKLQSNSSLIISDQGIIKMAKAADLQKLQ